jgi:hypothetical protein
VGCWDRYLLSIPAVTLKAVHRVGVIADDLTGANDTGVQFSKYGLSTKIDPTDHDIAYTIAAALMDDDEEVVVAAALGMALMINPPDELLDDLLSALKTYQANERVASRLARAIGVYGPKAVPTLINIVEHDLPGKEYASSYTWSTSKTTIVERPYLLN